MKYAIPALLGLSCGTSSPADSGVSPDCQTAAPPAEDSGCFVQVAQATGSEELVYDLAWSPSHPLILTGSTTLLRLWRLDEVDGALSMLDELEAEELTRFNSVVWTQDGLHALAPSGEELRLFAVDPEQGSITELARSEAQHAELQRVDLSPDGALAVTCDQAGQLAVYGVDLEGARLETLGTLDVHDRCTRVDWSPDGTRVLSVGHDGQLAMTALTAAADGLIAMHSIQGPEETGEAIWLQDGVHAVAGTFGVANELWELEVRGERLERTATHCTELSGVGALEQSHAGDRLLVGDHNHAVRLFEVDPGTGQLSPRLSMPDDGMGVHSVRWSPDDRLVARTASNVDRLFVYELGACGQR